MGDRRPPREDPLAGSSPESELELDLSRVPRRVPSAPPDQAPPIPAPRYRPLPAEPVRRSLLKPIFILGLLGVGGYGGYYGYCTFKVGEKIHAFDGALGDLRQALLHLNRAARPEDIRQVVLDSAARVGVVLQPEEVQPSIEPLDANTMQKLPAVARTALGIAAKMPRHQSPRWVVGFRARFLVRHGVAKRVHQVERYSWFEWEAQP